MTTTPERRELDIVALVRRDVARAVRDAADHTASAYFAHGRLDGTLDPLRQKLALLAQRRPDLHAKLADHFDVSATPDEVAEAVTRYAHALLERRLHKTPPTTGPTILDPAQKPDPHPIRGAIRRAPPRPTATPPPGRSR
jgi:hypothetical protein